MELMSFLEPLNDKLLDLIGLNQEI